MGLRIAASRLERFEGLLGVLLALPIAFLGLSFVKIKREYDLHYPAAVDAADQRGGLFAYAIERRLDDPSFWAVFSVVISTLLVIRSLRYLKTKHPDHFAWVMADYRVIFFSFPAAAISSVYISAVGIQYGTFFWAFGVDRAFDGVHLIIQMIEGVINLTAITLGCSFIPLFFRLAKRAYNQKNKEDSLADIDTTIINAGLSPIFITLAVAVYAIILSYLADLADLSFFTEFGILKGLALMLLLIWPLLVIGIRFCIPLFDPDRHKLAAIALLNSVKEMASSKITHPWIRFAVETPLVVVGVIFAASNFFLGFWIVRR
ncbi:MAG: hypothetical protein AAGB29_01335 [Planctomycetota bacterium]